MTRRPTMEIELTVELAWVLFQTVVTALLNGNEPNARRELTRADRVVSLGDDLADAVLCAIRRGYFYNAAANRIAVVLSVKEADDE
jgi:hypothetical protein